MAPCNQCKKTIKTLTEWRADLLHVIDIALSTPAMFHARGTVYQEAMHKIVANIDTLITDLGGDGDA